MNFPYTLNFFTEGFAFQKSIESPQATSKKTSDLPIIKLNADCLPDQLSLQESAEYYLIKGDYKNSIAFFKQFIHEEDTPLDFYFKYALALRSIGNYEEALFWNEKYMNLSNVGTEIKHVLRLMIWPDELQVSIRGSKYSLKEGPKE